MSNFSILVVDDDISSLHLIDRLLKRKGYNPQVFMNPKDALKSFEQGKNQAAILDYYMPEMNGIELMKKLHQLDEKIPVIILTAARDVSLSVKAMKEGALTYIVKPVDHDELYLNLESAIKMRNLILENISLRESISQSHRFTSIVGRSSRMQTVFELTEKATKVKSTVMILGDTGVGKELIAKAIHFNSDRASEPFIKVNCAAFPESLLDAEFFGIEKNVATGVDARAGKFESADRGTLFLDEVGDMSITTQSKVLRVIQEREVERIGSTKTRQVDIRIISATSKNIPELIKKGLFREDLYYRLNVLVIHLPALKERKEDIPELTKHFIDKISKFNSIEPKKISIEAINAMIEYDWPGNVRELENCIERAIITTDSDTITRLNIPAYGTEIISGKAVFNMADEKNLNLEAAVAEFEKNIIIDSLKRNRLRQNKAASELGISERAIWYKIKKYGIDVKGI